MPEILCQDKTNVQVTEFQLEPLIPSSPLTTLQTRQTPQTPQTTTGLGLNLHRFKDVLFKYAKFVGPGLMVAVAYIDPGNYSTAVSAGASNQFSLLCAILLSNFIAIYLQCLCIKLGSVTGMDLSRCCRRHLPCWLNWIIYVFAECAIIATDIAEVIGTAIALNILIKVPLPAGVAITVVDVFAVMFSYNPGKSTTKFLKMFEYGVALLVLAVCICFAVELAYIPKSTSVGQVFRGFVPSHQMFQHNGIYTAISIVGATVMPHSLFLGSALVQPRLLEYDQQHDNYSLDDDATVVEITFIDSKATGKGQGKEKSVSQIREERYFSYIPSLDAIKYCMKYSMVELALTLFTVALFVNCAILVVAGSTLYNTPGAADADLYAIHDLLSINLAPAAGTIFMVALLFSGQSAGVVCTMAGQIVSEGHINWKLKPWQRRLATRAISMVPCLVISICIGREALSTALNASQVVLSILLPFLVAPLIYFTCKKSIMQVEVQNSDNNDEDNGNSTKVVNMANNWVVTITGVIVWIFLSVLNVYAIVQLGITGET
ncbi:hypothetical protein TBLA_0B08580 [Henningerozyma blattae CBS 6284]|uniref:Transporter protein SMF1/ESP1 n=1 Tax=Henningerozyma blattae (strain ATCC 34711 / CBS 6284 / DSM 70876 / NBRC 10599 / NRRL Y-10934 / UCD 77-7) TaxID=1071380 RepID=I2GZX1_HENB6|nr:hypothetical protein TBLA_0B08580 [Tetrapisispora blattae CBS 6284]CCH59673.1 hypothetical protein TBLA_0B08580 [Tetrapisispora blattae CBS 6284]